MPFFSIIIPSYNRPQKAMLAVKSVLSQTFEDYEIILVDDGSDADYNDLQILAGSLGNLSYWKKHNGGPANSRNFGISKASGIFICFLDDDDEYLPQHLETMYAMISSRGFVNGLYRTLTKVESGNGVNDQIYHEGARNSAMVRLYSNLLTTCNVAIPISIIRDNLFNEKIPISEDYELWTRILLKYPYFEEPKYTTIVHIHESSTSSGDPEMVHLKHIEAFREIFRLKGVKKQLPLHLRAELICKRYLWLSIVQYQRGKVLKAILSRISSIYYSILYKIA